MKRKLIEFSPYNDVYAECTEPPQLASNYIPDWYKRLGPRVFDMKDPVPTGIGTNFTAKMCAPFFDSFASGYMITANSDTYWSLTPDQPRVIWEVSWAVVEGHHNNQVKGMPLPYGYEAHPYKWQSGWLIKTPPGYSIMVLHPLNRFDLPFFTMSAIVDTDNHNEVALNFPFIIKSDFEGYIKKGTPIAQVIPFKRDSWSSKVKSFSTKTMYNFDRFKTTLEKAYKTQYWVRKDYK